MELIYFGLVTLYVIGVGLSWLVMRACIREKRVAKKYCWLSWLTFFGTIVAYCMAAENGDLED